MPGMVRRGIFEYCANSRRTIFNFHKVLRYQRLFNPWKCLIPPGPNTFISSQSNDPHNFLCSSYNNSLRSLLPINVSTHWLSSAAQIYRARNTTNSPINPAKRPHNHGPPADTFSTSHCRSTQHTRGPVISSHEFITPLITQPGLPLSLCARGPSNFNQPIPKTRQNISKPRHSYRHAGDAHLAAEI